MAKVLFIVMPPAAVPDRLVVFPWEGLRRQLTRRSLEWE